LTLFSASTYLTLIKLYQEVILGQTKTMKAEKKVKRVYVTVTLPERIKAQLDQLSLRTKRNRGVCIELALEQFLKANQLI
jgi:hypothetical protein